mmetsp:Transcript_9620/g.28966  ORF Transcript_9620/g.28966 Transcript_9620/m.28966 type:complete len:338 (-) Transcript_9620:241-1254(-)
MTGASGVARPPRPRPLETVLQDPARHRRGRGRPASTASLSWSRQRQTRIASLHGRWRQTQAGQRGYRPTRVASTLGLGRGGPRRLGRHRGQGWTRSQAHWHLAGRSCRLWQGPQLHRCGPTSSCSRARQWPWRRVRNTAPNRGAFCAVCMPMWPHKSRVLLQSTATKSTWVRGACRGQKVAECRGGALRASRSCTTAWTVSASVTSRNGRIPATPRGTTATSTAASRPHRRRAPAAAGWVRPPAAMAAAAVRLLRDSRTRRMLAGTTTGTIHRRSLPHPNSASQPPSRPPRMRQTVTTGASGSGCMHTQCRRNERLANCQNAMILLCYHFLIEQMLD